MEDFKLKQGLKGEVSFEGMNEVKKNIPKQYVDLIKIKKLVSLNLKNVVKYNSFKEEMDDSVSVFMEKLTMVTFPKDEKFLIESFLKFVENKVLCNFENKIPNNFQFQIILKDFIEYLKNKEKDFSSYEEQPFTDALSKITEEKFIHVINDIFNGYNELLENEILFDDLKSEHVGFSEIDKTYKLIDVV